MHSLTPPRAGWLAPDQIGPSQVEAWLSQQARQLRSRRDVAAAYVGWGLQDELISTCVASWLLELPVPDPAPDNVLLRVSAVGRVEAVRFRSGRALDDRSGLTLAEGLVATIGPLLATVRSLSTYRHAGLWGMVADSAAGTAVRLHDVGALEPERAADAWDRAQLFLQQLLDAGAGFRRRPHLIPDGPALRMVRSTCCMYYATPEAVEGPARERWCSTCPCAAQNRRIPPS